MSVSFRYCNGKTWNVCGRSADLPAVMLGSTRPRTTASFSPRSLGPYFLERGNHGAPNSGSKSLPVLVVLGTGNMGTSLTPAQVRVVQIHVQHSASVRSRRPRAATTPPCRFNLRSFALSGILDLANERRPTRRALEPLHAASCVRHPRCRQRFRLPRSDAELKDRRLQLPIHAGDI
jgi:hypothetical protein